MNGMPDEGKASVIASMQREIAWASTESDPPIRRQSLYYLDSIIRSVPIKESDPASLMRNVKALDLLVTPCTFFLHSHSDERLQNILNQSLRDIGEIVRLSLTRDFKGRDLDIASISSGLEYALQYRILNQENIRLILSSISPFERATGQNHFFEYFPSGKYIMHSLHTEIN